MTTRSATLFAVALLAGALSGCRAEAPPTAPIRPAIVVQAETAGRDLTETYAGEVCARVESALGFRIGGKVAARHVDVGSRVEAGDPIATLEAADLELAVRAARAALASAEADLTLASAELERHRELLARQLISRSLYDARVNAAGAAQARLAQARAQLALAENQAGYATLSADAAGVITALALEVGQVVAAGAPVATLAHDGDREVLIAVPESRIARFRPGLAVRSELWSRDDTRFPGVVREVAPEADPRTRTYDVRVTLAGAGETAKLGMTARVYLDAAEAPATVRVPLSALTARDGKAAVWRVDRDSGRVTPVAVEVGAYREDGATLLAGIEPGDWVVAAGVHQLADGQQIRPVDQANRPIAW